VETQFPPSLDNVRSPHGNINQRLQIQFGAPDDEHRQRPVTTWVYKPEAANSLELLMMSLDNDRSPHGFINQRLQIEFGAPDYERYDTRNMLSLQ
jgi:hypothetical protein